MSDSENFLTRWSRRKREVAEETAEAILPEPPEQAPASERAAEDERKDVSAPPSDSAKSTELIFDPANLPPIESITADTDIRAFLAPGVPPELTRAALRRAWASDPAIRDYVGLSENAWDFNAPDGVPGFAPLNAADDIRRLVAQVIGGPGEASETAHAEQSRKPAEAAEPTPSPSEFGTGTGASAPHDSKEVGPAPQDQVGQIPMPVAETENSAKQHKVDVALQRQPGGGKYRPFPPRRAHGRALPE